MKRDEQIADLRVQIGGGHSALVVGAGVSILATGNDPRASWSGLLRDGAETAAEKDAEWLASVNARLETASVEQLFSVADEVVARLTAYDSQRGGLRRWLQRSVGSLQAREPEVLHRLIALDRPIITTNYDSLLEKARGDGTYVSWEDYAGFQQVLRNDSSRIVHLHGHWSDPDRVLLSRASYIAKVEHNVRELQKGLMLLHSLVFVGVGEGIRDPDLSELIAWASRTSRDSNYTHYRLCRESEVDQLRLQHRSDNIEVVAYGAEYEDLPSFLHLLAPARIEAPPAPAPRLERRAARVSDLDEATIDDYADRRGLDPRLPFDDKVDELGLVDDSREPFDWALLCFARDPGSFFPGAELKLVNATTKSVATVDGPLTEQVSRGMELLRRLVELRHLDDDGRELFFRALREALSNAVVHRDYGGGGATRIHFGPESVTIRTPGHLPPSIDRSNVLEGVSQPPHLYRARVLQYLGAAEGAGLGFESFREFGDILGARFPGAAVTVVEERGQVVTTLTVPRGSSGSPPEVARTKHLSPPPPQEPLPVTVDHPAPQEQQPERQPDLRAGLQVLKERRNPLLTPVHSSRPQGELTWPAWLTTLDQRTQGLTAKDLVIAPQQVLVPELSKGWSRTQRDTSPRSLAEVLAVKPLRAVISTGDVSYDTMLAVVIAALWESGRYVGLVWEEDVDASELAFLVPENAVPLPVVVASEPIRTYYPIADISHEFILLTKKSVDTLPVGLDALFWRFDRLHDGAVSSRLSAIAQGELKTDAAAAAVLKKLIITPDDITAANKAVRPLGSGSSLVDILTSVEARAARYGANIAQLRRIVRSAYPWTFPVDSKSFPPENKSVQLTGEAIDRWTALRESRFRKRSMIAAMVAGVVAGALSFFLLGRPVVDSVLFGVWGLLTVLTGLLARVRISTTQVPWYAAVILFAVIQTTFSLVLTYTFGFGLATSLWMLGSTSLVYSLCRLIGHVRVSTALYELTHDGFYEPGAHGAIGTLDGAKKLHIVELTERLGELKTPQGRTIDGVKKRYSITSPTLFQWLS